MRFSQLFTKTLKEASAEEVAINAQLLMRGGFVFKNSAGVYSYLPLGWRVLTKIANIIREEMNTIGGQEMFMPALVDRKYMETTGRWNLDVGYDAKGKNEKEASFTLGWTHEEVLTAITSKYISSYKDLPFSAYQIQTKFRHEARAKSGLLRGREFIMKDLYSFHTDEGDLSKFYAQVGEAYHKIFRRCGLEAIYTVATGGDFTSSYTHEFQVLTPVGEDTVFICDKHQPVYAVNKEYIPELEKEYGKSTNNGTTCILCGGELKEYKGIEVGNIFPLGDKYSSAFNLQYTDKEGTKKPVIMGSYGIGLGRVMGTIVEVSHDDKGIIWPENIAPFKVHLISLGVNADDVYENLKAQGVEVLYDDREDKSAGEKFADADLIGCPWRLVVSSKMGADEIEIKKRTETKPQVVKRSELAGIL